MTPPIILALDSSSQTGIVALHMQDGTLLSLNNTEVQRHNAFLLPAIQQLCKDAKIQLAEIDYIACGIGPGSFVGTRLAVSVAQGLAYALKKPLLALNHLHLLAHMAQRLYHFNHPAIALDAKMRAFYFLDQNHHTHFYRLDQLDPSFKVKLCTLPEKIGNAWPLLDITNPLPLIELNATDVLKEAQLLLQSQTIIHTPSELLPLYLNDQDNWKKWSC